jgi:hypothetical protein
MRNAWKASVAALLAVSCAAWAQGDTPAKLLQEKPCGDYGTSVTFERSPTAAARKALKEEKLVMVLHVSGDFEDPEFT